MKFLEKHYFHEIPFFYTFIKDGKAKRVIHTHDFYEIFLTLSDNFLHTVNGIDYRLPQGSLVFIRPWDNHANQNPNEPHSYVQIGYTQDIADSLFGYLGADYNIEKLKASENPPCLLLSSQDCSSLFRSLKRIESLDMNNKVVLSKYYKNLLFHIFADYFSKYITSDNKVSSAPKWLSDTCKQAQADKLFIEGIDSIVAASGKSYKHFARSLKHYYDKTPSEFVMDLRLAYALNLITTTNFSITDISYLSGFNNPSYFYKNFIKKYEKTPTQIRKDTPVSMLNV
ncbi:MAG: helix-turn-helix domain-containing protein [Clostridia bacterium]|nr:helix-turn-helix domain-containing protein [Clostridia bacterium]